MKYSASVSTCAQHIRKHGSANIKPAPSTFSTLIDQLQNLVQTRKNFCAKSLRSNFYIISSPSIQHYYDDIPATIPKGTPTKSVTQMLRNIHWYDLGENL